MCRVGTMQGPWGVTRWVLPVQVYKGRWNGVLVAVKVLNDNAAEGMKNFQQECAILERLRHPNIVKFFGTASNAEGHVSQPFRSGHLFSR